MSGIVISGEGEQMSVGGGKCSEGANTTASERRTTPLQASHIHDVRLAFLVTGHLLPPSPDTCPLARLFRVMALTFMVTAYGVRVKAGSQHTN